MQVVTAHQEGNCTTFRVVGDLAGESVSELERCWRKVADQYPRNLRIDLCHTQQIDASGKRLLSEMFGAGIEIMVPVRNHEKQS